MTAAELAAIRAATSHLTDAEFREKYTPLLAHFERWRGRLNRSFGLDEMGSMEPAITHAERLGAELTRAREILWKYGRHFPSCDAIKGWPCTCGLGETLGEEPADGDTER